MKKSIGRNAPENAGGGVIIIVVRLWLYFKLIHNSENTHTTLWYFSYSFVKIHNFIPALFLNFVLLRFFDRQAKLLRVNSCKTEKKTNVKVHNR